ncbi:Auxin-responsive protein SAUR19-like protein [Drosera capensis]
MGLEKVHAKKILGRALSAGKRQRSVSFNDDHIPKGHIAVYAGEDSKKRFVIPITYLNHTLFIDLLHRVEEEYGYVHPMGGLTIPCSEDHFLSLISHISCS